MTRIQRITDRASKLLGCDLYGVCTSLRILRLYNGLGFDWGPGFRLSGSCRVWGLGINWGYGFGL